MTLEKRINNEVEDFINDWFLGDYNIFKFENDEEWDVDEVDDKEINDIVSCVWQKGNYIYVELNVSELQAIHEKRIKEWDIWRDEEFYDFYNSRW